MSAFCCPRLRGIIAVALLLALLPSPSLAQDVAIVSTRDTAVPDSAGDSIEIVPGAKYQAGGLHRTLLGNGYRDLWATPLRVQVLDLATFRGGLRPLKESGGNQTKSLRFVTPDGTEYVFRSVAKDAVTFPPAFKGTVVQSIARDQVSSHFPVAGLVAAPILQAAGVLHVTPMLVVMPDDPRLGEFQSKFANRLGMIEEYPTVPKNAPGFAGAVEIIGSDSLLVLIDSSSGEQVDARALLAARLMDMLLNDWDRHQGQWMWARMQPGPAAPWLPIARDRDKAFISYGGALPGMARLASPNLMSFDSTYPSVRGLTWNSLPFDRRMLSGLNKSVFDSVAATLAHKVTDSVIDAAVQALPVEYRSIQPLIAQTLKVRRDSLSVVADRFYFYLAPYVDIHASDVAEQATVTRVDDRFVVVQLQTSDGNAYLFPPVRPRGNPRDTRLPPRGKRHLPRRRRCPHQHSGSYHRRRWHQSPRRLIARSRLGTPHPPVRSGQRVRDQLRSGHPVRSAPLGEGRRQVRAARTRLRRLVPSGREFQLWRPRVPFRPGRE